jgi:outer membrane protein OmpA-like peptidoglycan-associated protein
MPLGNNDNFPTDLSHKVQVYQGTIDNVSFQHEYKPEQHRILKSFVLSTVPDIEINGNESGPFSDKRIYTFQQLIIVDPKIERTYTMNNSTYGELSGKVYGYTEKNPQITRLNPPPPPNGGNSSEGSNDATGNGGNNGNELGGGSSGGAGSTEFDNETEIGRIINQSKEGCFSLYSGCLENIWRILVAILLLLFLWWLIRSCNQIANDNRACDRKEKIFRELTDEERKNKKLKEQYEQRIERFINANQNIFFYKNSSEQTLISQKQNTLRKWAKLIKTCKEKKFEIIGHHAGRSLEDKYSDIDLRRAKRTKYELTKLGVKSQQIICLGMANKETKYSNEIRQIRVGKSMRSYNRNMRVEIRVKK